MTIVEFIDGPLWYFSSVVFLVGVAGHFVSVYKRGIKRDYSVPRTSASSGGVQTVFSRFLPRTKLQSSMGFQFFWGYMFHISLFALLIFGRPHIEFYEARILGFSWTSMPDWVFLIVSEIAFGGLLVLLLYRAMEPVTRLISSKGDYFGSLLILLVILTGCAAMDQSSEPVRVVHLLLAEVLLIYFPFGSLMHAFLFVPSRYFTGAFFTRRGVNA